MKTPLFLLPYGLAWRLARPFLRRHKRLAEGFAHRLAGPDWPDDLLPGSCAGGARPPYRLWIHAASGGEAYLAWQLAEELAARLGNLNILCTSMTRQGIEVLAKMQAALGSDACCITVSYLPLDEPGLMRRAVARAFGQPGQSPRGLVLLETELWPGLLAACREAGAEVYVINGRMRLSSLKAYQRLVGTLRALAPKKIFAVSPADVERFSAIFDAPGAASRVALMPNMKFDRALPAPDERENPLRPLLRGCPVLLLASVREEEEGDILGLLAPLRLAAPEAAIIVAPRHMHRAAHWIDTLAGMLAGTPHFKMRSKGVSGIEAGDIILWDSFGELMDLYDIADAAFVGGSLAPLGGQNFLEPLSFGLRPVIGPFWSNFYWVGEELFRQDLAQRVQNAGELEKALLGQLQSPLDKADVKRRYAEYLKDRQGGVRQAVDFLLGELWGK